MTPLLLLVLLILYRIDVQDESGDLHHLNV